MDTFVLRIAIALALGVAIGMERQWRQRMAGLRTNALVAVGSALFASISILMNATQNPTQVAAYVVSGIGFLAGAVIFKEGFSVRGLNTAATLWATAAVGTLCGSGFLPQAAAGAAAVIGANVLLRPLVQRINRQPFEQTELSREYTLRVVCREADESTVRSKMLQLIQQTTLLLRAIESRNLESGNVEVLAAIVTSQRAETKVERIVGRMSLDPAIVAASWRAGALSSEEPTEE
ncbi:MAG TPA: MgtC/SapB family protein [Candidatus Baltobacteraceae bacterium]|nr:MgtC/SapB family protein [Candidatus Baltobacteraceae bacterium]